MDDLGRLRWGVFALLVALAFASAGWALARNGDFEGAALNLGTELVGAVVTYALFELVIERREQREAKEEAVEAEKAILIAQMGSSVNDVAVFAVERLRREGWLFDGSLEEAYLGAADLRHADLQGAYLTRVDLTQAHLQSANLVNTVLRAAQLEGADVDGADLAGSDMTGAKVSVQQLCEADSLKGATLPDGKILSFDRWQAEFEEWRKKQEGQQ